MKKKYTYLLEVYFADKSKIQSTSESNQSISKFTNNFNKKAQKNNIEFWNIIGDKKKIMINKNNILFYTIELVRERKSIEDILKITQKSKGDVKNENNNI